MLYEVITESYIHTYSITAPTADFTANATSGSAPLAVQFTDQSSNGPTAWEWDFNSDGKIDSTEQNPLYVYTAQGTYSVTLNAINGTARGSTTKSNYITVGNLPVAAFTVSPQEGDRITSYNVCYTKLLRNFRLRESARPTISRLAVKM